MNAWPSSYSYRASFLDPDHIATVASGTEIKVNRLSAAERPSFVRQMRSPDRWGLDLIELHCHLQADGALQSGSMAVLLVLEGADSTICGVPLKAGMIVTLPSGAPIEASVSPGLAHVGAVLAAEDWDRIQSNTTGVVAVRSSKLPSVVQLPPNAAERLTAVLGRTAQSLAAPPHAAPIDLDRRGAFEGYLAAVAEARLSGEDRYQAIDRSTRRRFCQAHQARDFIRAHLNEPISIDQVARAIGVSRRQLEYAFRTTFDVSPREFIHLRRLNEIRRTLLQSRPNVLSVTQAALDHGVSHLGRFAVSYRELFGESPSQTLRRGRPG
jgi:AraC-like DNA-binding protein